MKGTKSLEGIRGSAVKRFHQNSESWKVAEKCALNETEWKNHSQGVRVLNMLWARNQQGWMVGKKMQERKC